MLDPEMIDDDVLAVAKRRLRITWSDPETDLDVWDRLCRSEQALNAKIGAAPDYFSEAGFAQAALLALLLYAWNDAADQFDEAYYNDVQQLRALYAIDEDDE